MTCNRLKLLQVTLEVYWALLPVTVTGTVVGGATAGESLEKQVDIH